MSPQDYLPLVRLALEEDVGPGDVTTLATVPAALPAVAQMIAREPLVVCGLAVAVEVFRQIDARIQIELLRHDGDHVDRGTPLLRASGPARGILTGERVALNFVQRMSGVATMTARFVEAVHGTRAKILDTRKTTPGFRRLEKYAVTCGGGKNHRIGLFDLVLIKDNHLAALADTKPNPIAAAVARARTQFPQLKVEVEADTLDQVAQALDAGADIILLDNMKPDQLRAAVRLVAGRAQTEASGGVNLDTVRSIAETGVDFVSAGAITHSARAVDVALDFEDIAGNTPKA